jgi:DNA-binding NtrC family response regulator
MLHTRILLIDDEEAFLAAMKKRLTKRHMLIECASSGPEGLNKLAENSDIDVVILDVKMPVMDGIDTLKEIKRTFPLIEVILLTGHGTFQSAIQGMKIGAFDYLMKPCDLEELLIKVEEAKRKKRRHMEKIMEASEKSQTR